MAEIKVTDITIPALLSHLSSGEWLTPEFQREFVWNNSAVIGLINSVIDAKPIGMVTLWEQEDKSDLALEHISVPDWDASRNATGPRYFGDNAKRPGRYFAILDGKQRSTAIALVFGGLRAQSGSYRNSGRYFLNVAAEDPLDRISYVKESEVLRLGLNVLATAVSKGLFPLACEDPTKIFKQWMDYTAMIGNKEFYPNGILPDTEELSRRNKLLQDAFDGIISTKLAVYVVPQDQSLAEICEVFETLNTTGTKVSTVDLIHSWLYADSLSRLPKPILLRQEIDELGDLDGAVGWSSSKERPEIIAQFAAAIHVALDNKPEPRNVSGAKVTKITSIKSPDLLAVPDKLWEKFFEKNESVGRFLGDMQDAVGGGRFTLNQCPYPAVATIYVGLRWFLEFDAPSSNTWAQKNLDSIFRAFFWRNAFTTRYDQGFLTKVGRDISDIKELLASCSKKESFEDWKVRADSWLESLIPRASAIQNIREAVSDGTVKGALRKAATLLLYTRARNDVVDMQVDIRNTINQPQLHHIFPRDWCANNVTDQTRAYLDEASSGKDWVNSVANLIPMDRKSNIKWRAQNPAMALKNLAVTSPEQFELLNTYFVDKQCRAFLSKGSDGLGEFFERRSKLLEEELTRKLSVY